MDVLQCGVDEPKIDKGRCSSGRKNSYISSSSSDSSSEKDDTSPGTSALKRPVRAIRKLAHPAAAAPAAKVMR